jgi:hypothetical protein
MPRSKVDDVSDALQGYNDAFVPADPLGNWKKADCLPDGVYDLEIKDARFKQVPPNLIVEMRLSVLTAGPHAGVEFQHSIFINDQQGADRFGRFLGTLGFDVNNWKKDLGRPFSREAGRAMLVLPGLRAEAEKVTKAGEAGTGKAYHNLYFRKRLSTDGRPPTFGKAELDEAEKGVEADVF